MDKLIKNRFWILLVLVLPMVVFGYYSANGAIKEATDARVGQLNKALSEIPEGNGPNPTFVKAEYGGLDVYNAQLRKAVDVEMVRVWEDQKPRMTWPAEMADHGFVPDAYRGEFTSDAVYTYKEAYGRQLLKLHESIEPIKLERNGAISGKVHYERASLPRYQFGPLSVPSETIWDAQEDIWLLQLLFDAIRNTNRSAENAAKAAVRQVYTVQLMGGDGEFAVRSAGVGSFGGGGREDGDEDFGDPMGGGPMPTMGGGMGGMGAVGQINVAFNPAEEFGNSVDRAGSSAAGPAGGNFVEDDDGGPAGFSLGGPGMPTGPKLLRYIKLDESARLQERGFYMSVLIDQKKIADFLVELSNADWPIRVVRFNVGPNSNSGSAGGRRGMASSPFGGGGGGGRYAEDGDDPHEGSAFRGGLGGGSGMGMGMGMGMPMSPMGGGDEFDFSAPGFGAMSNGDEAELGMPGGGIGPQQLVSGDKIRDLFTHPDLVQMDLCGVITMYKPATPELLAAVMGATATAGDAAAAPAGDDSANPAGEVPAGDETAEPAATEGDAAAAPATTGESNAEDASSTDAAAGGEAGATPSGESAAPAAGGEPTGPAAGDEPAAPAAVGDPAPPDGG